MNYHEGTQGKYTCTTFSVTSALDEVGWSTSRSTLFASDRDLVTTFRGLGGP